MFETFKVKTTWYIIDGKTDYPVYRLICIINTLQKILSLLQLKL